MSVSYIGNNWIDQLPKDVRSLVSARMSRRQVAKGEVVYHEGQLHQALWQVREGTVKVTNQSVDGKEVIFALFSTGDCFGELCLIDGIPAVNTATAVDRVELLELPKSDFDELLDAQPSVSRQLMYFLSIRMRHMLSFYSDVALRPLEQRIARRICYLRAAESGGIADRNLQFTQQELAAMVGATRQAVSKVLNEWRGQGLIALEYGKLSVFRVERLQAIADGEL